MTFEQLTIFIMIRDSPGNKDNQSRGYLDPANSLHNGVRAFMLLHTRVSI